MKGFVRLIAAVAAATALIVSCSKDKDSGAFTLDTPAVFLPEAGDMATVGFSTRNIKTISVTSKPTGWQDPVIDLAGGTITIYAPTQFGDDAVTSGSMVFSAATSGGTIVSGSLFVGVVPQVDLTGKVANSYLVQKKESRYLFDARRKGDGSSLATDHVGVIWQSKTGLVQYLQMDDDKVSFYIGADGDDDTKVSKGNALIGAYDANDELIWSWHIWATDYDPDADGGSVYFGSYHVMTRNLGALANSNATTDEILASYGLYYQWGRKDPFIGPSAYNAPKGDPATMYNAAGSRVYLKTEPSSAETGTMEYAVKNPLVYITGVAGSENDWLWSGHSDALWADTKTVNDPCPYGWRVAPARAFSGLAIMDTPAAGDEEKYGWTLYDPSNIFSSLFMGAGRRRYDNGKIQNVYIPRDEKMMMQTRADVAQPWEGLYWTTGTQSGVMSSALYFWFEKLNTSAGIEHAAPYARANGMQVRCVKVE